MENNGGIMNNEVDSRKILIRLPELCGKVPAESSDGKQEKWAKGMRI
jgi:hypothetical protein